MKMVNDPNLPKPSTPKRRFCWVCGADLGEIEMGMIRRIGFVIGDLIEMVAIILAVGAFVAGLSLLVDALFGR